MAVILASLSEAEVAARIAASASHEAPLIGGVCRDSAEAAEGWLKALGGEAGFFPAADSGVRLDDEGLRPSAVLDALQGIQGVTIWDAMSMLKDQPSTILEGVDVVEAARLGKRLTDVGATVEVIRTEVAASSTEETVPEAASDVAPGSGPVPGPSGDADTASQRRPPREPWPSLPPGSGACRVILLERGPRKVSVVKLVRDVVPGRTLTEAVGIVETAPSEVLAHLSADTAETLRSALEGLGARAVVQTLERNGSGLELSEEGMAGDTPAPRSSEDRDNMQALGFGMDRSSPCSPDAVLVRHRAWADGLMAQSGTHEHRPHYSPGNQARRGASGTGTFARRQCLARDGRRHAEGSSRGADGHN